MSTKKTKRHYMYFNVILTFNTSNRYGDSQEFFEMKLPLKKDEVNAVTYLMEKFFPKIVNKCKKFDRSATDLIKISTASDWDLFEKVTGLDSLCGIGHSCKWYFGEGRKDLDVWENYLIKKYGFGTNADMSYLNDLIEKRKNAVLEET